MNQFIGDWLYFLDGPNGPPFERGTDFEGQLQCLIRVLLTSCTLTAAVLGLGSVIQQNLASDLATILFRSTFALQALVFVACFGILYALLARIFGIKIGMRQSVYIFGLVITPWLPIIAAVVVLGRFPPLAFLWYIAIFCVPTYVLSLLGTAIRMVSGAKRLPVIASLAVAVLIGLFGALKVRS